MPVYSSVSLYLGVGSWSPSSAGPTSIPVVVTGPCYWAYAEAAAAISTVSISAKANALVIAVLLAIVRQIIVQWSMLASSRFYLSPA